MTDIELALSSLPEPARMVTYNESKGYQFAAFTEQQMIEMFLAGMAAQAGTLQADQMYSKR
jgi:hypothetical protein